MSCHCDRKEGAAKSAAPPENSAALNHCKKDKLSKKFATLTCYSVAGETLARFASPGGVRSCNRRPASVLAHSFTGAQRARLHPKATQGPCLLFPLPLPTPAPARALCGLPTRSGGHRLSCLPCACGARRGLPSLARSAGVGLLHPFRPCGGAGHRGRPGQCSAARSIAGRKANCV